MTQYRQWHNVIGSMDDFRTIGAILSVSLSVNSLTIYTNWNPVKMIIRNATNPYPCLYTADLFIDIGFGRSF